MEQAIKKAIELAIKGGWEPGHVNWEPYEWKEFVCSPRFWQALGKAVPHIGEKDMWKETPCSCGGIDFHIAGHDAHKGDCDRVKAPRGPLFHWKKMIDHLWENKSPDSFFEQLFTNT